MSRWFLSWVGITVLAVLAGSAAADPPAVMPRTYTMVPAHPAPAEKPVPGATSPYIFFNRCVGGCQVTGGTVDDARSLESSLPCPAPTCTVGSCSCPGGPSGTWTIEEFKNQFGDIGGNGHCYGDSGTTACTQDAQCSGTCGTGSTCVGGTKAGQTCTGDQDCADICDTADYEWTQIMQCLKEVYSPFNVMVSDVAPAGGVSYTEDIIAGKPANIGYPGSSVGGIAPGGCDARNNVLSFSFSNINWGSGQSRIWTLCGVAGQETAHAFGLEHEYDFLTAYPANNHSTCMDPMTYRNDCGGEPFFRNAASNCGEFMERPCVCGGTQNSHQKIFDVFGAGTTTVPKPTAEVTFPAAGATVSGTLVVAANAGSRRGVSTVELWLNGFKWASVDGAAFGQNGQPNPAGYSLTAPANVPNGVVDVVVKAYDDLGAEGDSQTVTITKGAPCSDAASCMCLTGQKFENGKCFWDPPSGQLGDACSYPQFCVSGMCSPTTKDQVCTQACTVGISDSCPTGYDCVMQNGVDGFCYPSAGGGGGGGCCSAGGSPRTLWLQAGLAALVLGLVTRRRRRR